MKQFLAIILLSMIGVQPIWGMGRSFAAPHVRTAATRIRSRTMSQFRTLEVRSQRDIDEITQLTDLYFKNIPGYPQVKERLTRSLENPQRHAAKGYAYELETALYLVCKEHHTIFAFEKKYTHPAFKFTREIDLTSNRCACECKNINWESVKRSPYISAQLATQFSQQNELVRSGVVGVPHFMVCSKNPIPFDWKLWLSQRNILYMEGPYQ